jgi:hypothetical protein
VVLKQEAVRRVGYSVRKPARHVGRDGDQSSSRFALALEAPRPLVSTEAANPPAAKRTSQAGTRHGRGAPMSEQKAGIHSRPGAGSSSRRDDADSRKP